MAIEVRVFLWKEGIRCCLYDDVFKEYNQLPCFSSETSSFIYYYYDYTADIGHPDLDTGRDVWKSKRELMACLKKHMNVYHKRQKNRYKGVFKS